MKIDELRSAVAGMRDEIVRMSAIEDITPEDDAILDATIAEFEIAKSDLDAMDAREARIDAAKATVIERTAAVSPTIMRRVDPTVLDLRTATRGEVRDAALKVLENEGETINTVSGDKVDRLLRTQSHNVDGSQIARRLIITESDAYRSAFAKALTQNTPAFTADESNALNEYRAMSGGVDTAGGFAVPVLIDPTIIITSGAAAAPVLNLARVITVTTDSWKGVSSAGVSWSYDAEGAEVSDDSPTIAQPEVPVYTARGFVPFSIEIGADWPAFADEMRMLLDSGYVDLLAGQTMTGSGSAQPTGIFAALSGNTNSTTVVTTDGAFGAVDLLAAWKNLPERYRGNASWIMHTDVENEIRGFSSGSNGAYYTVNITQGGVGTLFGRPVYTTDYAPQFTGTTAVANILTVGDFSQYVIAQRAGMSVELIPFLLGLTNNRPTGQRGFFATARHGADSVNDRGFQLLQNT